MKENCHPNTHRPIRLNKVPQPRSLKSQESIIEINLSNVGLTELTEDFFVDNYGLEYLNVQNNKLTRIPDIISNLPNLKTLLIDHNNIITLPANIGNLPLKTLSLSYNHFVLFPKSIIKAKNTLKVLNVANNNIAVLPNEIGELPNLEELYIQNNKLSSIPCTFSQLKKLSIIGLEWFLYTNLASSVVKGPLAIPACKRLRELCSSLKKNECTIIAFFNHFRVASLPCLHIATSNNHNMVLKSLIQLSYDLNAIDKDNYSPLLLAIKHSNREAINLLLEHKADIVREHPLLLAVAKGDLWSVKKLLKYKVDVNCVDERLNSPMHVLLSEFDKDWYKSQVIGETLLAAGAKLNLKNRQNYTPLHLACIKGQIKAVQWVSKMNKWLKNKGLEQFNFNAIGGKESNTMLHLAIHCFDIVVSLVELKANVFAKNKEGKIPRRIIHGDCVMTKVFRKIERIKLREVNKEANDNFLTPMTKSVRKQNQTYDDTLFSIRSKKYLNEDAPCYENNKVKGNQSKFIHTTRISGIKPIFYLKDKVLNNKLSLYDRYDAFNKMIGLKCKVQVRQIVVELLEKLLDINKTSLQLSIVKIAGALKGLVISQQLNKYKHKTKGILQQTILNEIENIGAINIQPRNEVIRRSRSIKQTRGKIIKNSMYFANTSTSSHNH